MPETALHTDNAGIEAFRMARPGTPLARLMSERGNYVPQDLIIDLEEACRFIAIKKGASEAEAATIKLGFSTPPPRYGKNCVVYLYVAPEFGEADDRMKEIGEEAARIMEQNKKLNTRFWVARTEMIGDNYRQILEALYVDYIKPNYPEAGIDVGGAMDAEVRSWAENVAASKPNPKPKGR